MNNDVIEITDADEIRAFFMELLQETRDDDRKEAFQKPEKPETKNIEYAKGI